MMKNQLHLYKQLVMSKTTKLKLKPKLQISIENLKILVILAEILPVLDKAKGKKSLLT
jgi:hypothetical protein